MTRSFPVVVNVLLVLVAVGCGDGSGSDGGVDATAAADAGSPPDAGSRVDAGRMLDSGVDAGPRVDAGPDSGSTPDAGTPGSVDPSMMGSRTVSTETDMVSRDGRMTPVTAYVPDGAATPLVVFAPGFQIEASNYEATLRYVASHGFTVVGADPPEGSPFNPLNPVNHTAMRDDLVAVIDWALAELSPAPGVLVLGHSLGGKLATMVAGADSRVTAMMGIDPVNGGNPLSGYSATLPDVVPDVTSTLTIPVAYLGETTNATGGIGGMACAPMDQNFQTFYDGSTSATAAYEHTFVGADHMDFLDNTTGCGFACAACTEGSANTGDVSSSTHTLVAAFALRHLSGVTSVEGWLTGANMLPAVTVRSR